MRPHRCRRRKSFRRPLPQAPPIGATGDAPPLVEIKSRRGPAAGKGRSEKRCLRQSVQSKARAFCLPRGEVASRFAGGGEARKKRRPRARERERRRGKSAAPGAKFFAIGVSPFSARAHAVTATDRESTPGSWQKTGRSKPDAFYARPPPALGAGV